MPNELAAFMLSFPGRVLSLMTSALLVLTAGCTSGHQESVSVNPKDYPLKFVESRRYPAGIQNLRFLDLNNDGIDERLTLSASERPGGSHLIVNQSNESVIDQVNFGPCQLINFELAYDLNRDGDDDIFVLTRERDTLFMNVVDVYHTKHSSLLARFPLTWREDSLVSFLPDQVMHFSTVIDTAAGRSHRILIGTMSSYMSKTPRGVLAYDIDVPRLLWLYPTGPLPNDPTIIKGADPARPMIVFGSRAPDNGSVANGTDDAHSYIFGLSIDGKPLWPPRETGREFSEARIFAEDVNDDGSEEILCLFSSASKVYEKSAIKYYNPVSGARIGSGRAFENQLVMPEQSPLHRLHQEPHYVIALTSGSIVVLDSSFNRVMMKTLPIEPVGLQFADIDGDGSTDVILQLNTGITIGLTEALEPLAYLTGQPTVSLSNCNQARRTMLVLRGETETLTGRLEQGPRVFTLWILVGGCVIILSAVAITGGRFLYYYLLIRRSSENAPTIAIMLLNARGKILFTNSTFERVFPNSGHPRRRVPWQHRMEGPVYEPIRDLLGQMIAGADFGERRIDLMIADVPANLVVRYHRIRWGGIRLGHFVAIQNVTEHVRRSRVLNWALIAQNLAHEMKTPLSTIWFTLARIRQQEDMIHLETLEDHLQSIEEEMRRVDSYVKGFMKLANINPPNLLATDLNKILQDTIASYREKLPQTVSIELDLARDLPAVKLDVHLFTVAMRNLFDNAVTAMKGKGILKISTYLAQKLNNSQVLVAISDTGCGIAEEDIPKLFQPYFSKSGLGSGLGLIITKKIVEDHDGGISFTTREGLGTEFVIELPASDIARGERHAA